MRWAAMVAFSVMAFGAAAAEAARREPVAVRCVLVCEDGKCRRVCRPVKPPKRKARPTRKTPRPPAPAREDTALASWMAPSGS